MDKIVDHLFVFRGNAVIEDFPGNYSDFRVYEDSTPKEETPKKEKIEKVAKEKTTKVKLSYNEKREFDNLEKDIATLEEKKKEIEVLFANGEVEDVQKTSMELQEIMNSIEEKEERWFEISSKLEGE
ncbi:hypothetical protein [Aureivirga marina]